MKNLLADIRNPNCTLCKLHQSTDIVCEMGFGSTTADTMVVSKMANSRAYQAALEMELTTLGLDVSEVYFTSVSKCKTFEHTATKTEVKTCSSEYLEKEIERVKPKFILALGNEALLATTGKSGITKHRGRVYPRPDGVEVIGTVSPSAVNRNPGQKPAYIADLRLFVNKAAGREVGIPDPKYTVIDTDDKLKKLRAMLMKTKEIYFDIETVGTYYEKGARIVSLAGTCEYEVDGEMKRWVFALPLSHSESPWRKKWRAVIRFLAPALGRIPKVVAHNSSYDCKWMHVFEEIGRAHV